MKLVLAHFRAQTLEYIRYPSFSIPSLAFPALFFLFFVAPNRKELDTESFLASYCAFALLGVVFFQFGVGIAIERVQPWERYLRTLPVASRTRFAARVLTGLLFGSAATAVVAIVAVASTGASVSSFRWLLLAAGLLGGAIPHALLGIAIGYLASPRGALPAANLVYLALAFLGGLWTTDRHLPGVFERISPLLPTRQWGEVLWGAVEGRWPALPCLWLGMYTVAFGALAAWAYRRDEGERFG